MTISVFDLDHTLITDNSSFRFGAYLYRSNQLSLSAMFYAVGCYSLHVAGCLSLQSLHVKLFKRLFKGRSQQVLCAHARQFVSTHVSALIYQPAYTRLLQAKKRGDRLVILSSSPDFLVAPIADYFEVDEWAATPYQSNPENEFSTLGHVLSGEAKCEYLRKLMEKCRVSSDAVFAYSDSNLDLPMLDVAGHAIGVNPNRRLRSICKRRGWEII